MKRSQGVAPKMTAEVLAFCEDISPGRTPMYVRVEPMPDGNVDLCHHNVAIKVEENPGSQQEFGWKQIGAAVEAVSPIIRQGGRIAIIADVAAPEGPAASMLRRCSEPEDLLKPLRIEPTSDAREFAQLITAQQRARLYLRSNLATDLVEELGMFALESADEIQRLVNSSKSSAIIRSANFSWCEIQESRSR